MRALTIILAAGLMRVAAAQGPMSISLLQAKELAAKQSYSVQTSELEAEKARKKINEVLAVGLPQINADAGLQNYIDVPISVVPNFFGEGPEFLEAQFGLPWTTNARVQLSQLIFDGSYFIGVQATKELRLQSEEELQLAIRDAQAAAEQAYFGVLAAEEGAAAVAEVIPVLERSLAEAEAMQRNGFMEETDADRIRIELANSKDQLTIFQRRSDLASNFLRFYLGLPTGTPMLLTDNLQALIEDPAEVALLDTPLGLDGHVEHRIADTQLRLQELNLKNEKAAYLPKLSGFFSYQQQSFGIDKVVETDWYPATTWGLSLSLPIFSSGMRSSKVAQARIQKEQVEVNLEMTDQRIRLEEAQDRSDAATALALYRNQKDRLELARRVFDRTTTKFTEGLASSFELTTEQSNYLQVQQAYIQSVADLVNARTKLRKTLDLF